MIITIIIIIITTRIIIIIIITVRARSRLSRRLSDPNQGLKPPRRRVSALRSALLQLVHPKRSEVVEIPVEKNLTCHNPFYRNPLFEMLQRKRFHP